MELSWTQVLLIVLFVAFEVGHVIVTILLFLAVGSLGSVQRAQHGAMVALASTVDKNFETIAGTMTQLAHMIDDPDGGEEPPSDGGKDLN